MDVSFYQLLKTPLEKALPKLVYKIYQGGYRGLIICNTESDVKMLDNAFWTFSPGAFLPHGYTDNPNLQPIWLSTSLNNINQANLVVVTNGMYIPDKIFERCLDVFDGRDETTVLNARQRYTQYKKRNLNISFWKQNEAGLWEENQ